jgi:CheY-like chemotaxis protein
VLSIEVADSGVGIAQEKLDSLFAAGDGDGGTELGLAITYKLCRAMGGDITAKSKYGRGSVFTVTMPQKILKDKKLAVVDRPSEKRTLLYSDALLYAESLRETFMSLSVPVTLTTDPEEFLYRLEKEEYKFAFVSAGLAQEASSLIRQTGGRVRLVLLADLAQIPSADLPTLVMPTYAAPLAEMLNGGAAAFDVPENDVVPFITPDADILIVDDIATNLKVTESLLAPYKARIDCCLSGTQALKLVRENHYDLIFMDHMMPGLDGIETTAAIRALGGYHAAVPVVALTASAIPGMRDVFLHNGFNDYVVKPIEIIKLDEVMSRWMPKEKRVRSIFQSNRTAGEG